MRPNTKKTFENNFFCEKNNECQSEENGLEKFEIKIIGKGKSTNFWVKFKNVRADFERKRNFGLKRT